MNTSYVRYWFLAVRPKTLPASLMPVLVGTALAWREGKVNWVVAFVCFTFALLAQIVSNFLNDYFDYVKGSDREDRIGPQRAVAQGWISPSAMLKASFLLLSFACLLGCVVIAYAGWSMLWVGVAVCLGVYMYSAGPYPLAYKGWGDVCVVVFYGLVPVYFTYYTQALSFSSLALVCGLLVGVVSTNILVANNYRDREADALSNKKTTVVLFGERFGRYFYLLNGYIVSLLGVVVLYPYLRAFAALPVLYLIPHTLTWLEMSRIRTGLALNPILGKSARNLLLYSVLLVLALVFSTW